MRDSPPWPFSSVSCESQLQTLYLHELRLYALYKSNPPTQRAYALHHSPIENQLICSHFPSLSSTDKMSSASLKNKMNWSRSLGVSTRSEGSPPYLLRLFW